MTGFDRITFDPKHDEWACVHPWHASHGVVGAHWVAQGMSVAEIIEAYPYLEPDNVRQSLQYAAWLADESIQPTGAATT